MQEKIVTVLTSKNLRSGVFKGYFLDLHDSKEGLPNVKERVRSTLEYSYGQQVSRLDACLDSTIINYSASIAKGSLATRS